MFGKKCLFDYNTKMKHSCLIHFQTCAACIFLQHRAKAHTLSNVSWQLSSHILMCGSFEYFHLGLACNMQGRPAYNISASICHISLYTEMNSRTKHQSHLIHLGTFPLYFL